MHHWVNPRHQLVYRLTHGLTEVAQFPLVCPPIKNFTDISAVQPEVSVFLFVGHGILRGHVPGVHRCRVEGNVPESSPGEH